MHDHAHNPCCPKHPTSHAMCVEKGLASSSGKAMPQPAVAALLKPFGETTCSSSMLVGKTHASIACSLISLLFWIYFGPSIRIPENMHPSVSEICPVREVGIKSVTHSSQHVLHRHETSCVTLPKVFCAGKKKAGVNLFSQVVSPKNICRDCTSPTPYLIPPCLYISGGVHPSVKLGGGICPQKSA